MVFESKYRRQALQAWETSRQEALAGFRHPFVALLTRFRSRFGRL